jgi:amidase
LEASGNTIVSWDPPLHRDLSACIDKAYFLDGGAEYTDILAAGNEPATPLMKWILKKGSPKAHSAAESWKLNSLRNTLQISYAAQWNAAGIDAILCPANASVASAHGESTYWGYSSVFNILDYSAAIFPVGTVKGTDTWNRYPRFSKEHLSEEDARFEGYYEAGPEKYKDAPVCLQLVTRRYREEILLEIVERVVKDIGGGER